MSKKRLFVDMDGVMARFHDNILDSEGHVQIELMYTPEFFRTLEPFQNMIDAIKLFIKYHSECEVFSLSAAEQGDPPGFVRQKDGWLDECLPEIDKEHRIYPPCGVAKSSYISGGVSVMDYLLDDFNKNLREWIRDGGKSIKCKNNINHKGTGKFGGNVGNLWSGDMVSNLDNPEKILSDLEDFMGLEHSIVKPSNIYEKWFEEQTGGLPDECIVSFEHEKEMLLSWLNNWDILGFSDLSKYYKEICLERIDELTYQYGLKVAAFVKAENPNAFTPSKAKQFINEAIETVYKSHLNDMDFIRDQIHEHTTSGYYSLEQEEYLFEHVSEIAEAFNKNIVTWYEKNPSRDELPLDAELDCADRAISEMASKEMVLITATPVKENYPATEIMISRRDLEVLFEKADKEKPSDFYEYLKKHSWKEGDWVKETIDEFHSDMKDSVEIKNFENSNYTVLIMDPDSFENGNIYEDTKEVFYPERIEDGFVKELYEKGYEGYRILISDIQDKQLGYLFDGVLDESVVRNLRKTEFINMIKEVEGISAEDRKYLLENLDVVVNQYEQYVQDTIHRGFQSGDFRKSNMEKAILESVEKQELLICANPIKENYPATEIVISKRDLDRALLEIYDYDYWPVDDFLKEYTWDSGDHVKEFLESHPNFCKDAYNIQNFAYAKYSVVVTDGKEEVHENVFPHIVASFYPEKIDTEFLKLLCGKGYEGSRILVSGIDEPFFGTLLDGRVDDSLPGRFVENGKEKESIGSLTSKIKSAKQKCGGGSCKKESKKEL